MLRGIAQRSLLVSAPTRDPALVLDLVGTQGRYLDTAATQPAAVAEPVAAWKDLGAGVAATQATQLSRPTATATGLSFDGGDWLAVPSQTALQQTPGMCISSWIYPISAMTASTSPGWIQRDNGTSREFLTTYEAAYQRVGFYVFAPTQLFVATPTGIVPLSTWTNVVLAWLSDRHAIYINGVLRATSTVWTSAPTKTSVVMDIGRRTSHYWGGYVGGISVYQFGAPGDPGAAFWLSKFEAERSAYGV